MLRQFTNGIMTENKKPCSGCGATNYYHWGKVYTPDGDYEHCSECSKQGTPGLSPDVYFDSSKGSFQTDPNLCDRYKGPIPFSSKREKADVMRRLGLREAGDKEHGGRNFDKRASKQWDK